LSNQPVDDGSVQHAAVVRHANDSLIAAVEEARRCLGLNTDTATILDGIKKAMDVEVPPYGLTVIQTLCERERQNAFNQAASNGFPTIRREFEYAIQDFMIARDCHAPARQVHKIARNAWKEDPGADRRIREMEHQSPDQFSPPYRGRPELYDRGVVLAFESAVARAFGRSRVSWTRGTKDNTNTSHGVMLDVFVAAVRWAMCIAWQSSAPPGSKPPKVKAEGLLRIVKAQRR
jgi:hypothetical protein